MKIIKPILIFLCCVILASCASLRELDEAPDTSPDTAYLDSSLTAEAESADSSAPDTVDVATGGAESSSDTEHVDVVPTETIATETESEVAVPPAAVYKPKALMYHLILEEVYGPYEALFVRPDDFEAQLTYLDSAGYEYLFAEEWRLTDRLSVIITLDDGYEDNYTEMFPILKAHNAKATVFLVSELIGTDGYLTGDMIREMSRSGLVSFQCHTANHVDLAYQSEDTVRREFEKSCSTISELTGKSVSALAYPAGSYNDTVLRVTQEFFDFAYTTRSPYNTAEYTELTVPRYYISRTLGIESFKAMLLY